jgi:hypothetical protein
LRPTTLLDATGTPPHRRDAFAKLLREQRAEHLVPIFDVGFDIRLDRRFATFKALTLALIRVTEPERRLEETAGNIAERLRRRAEADDVLTARAAMQSVADKLREAATKATELAKSELGARFHTQAVDLSSSGDPLVLQAAFGLVLTHRPECAFRANLLVSVSASEVVVRPAEVGADELLRLPLATFIEQGPEVDPLREHLLRGLARAFDALHPDPEGAADPQNQNGSAAPRG